VPSMPKLQTNEQLQLRESPESSDGSKKTRRQSPASKDVNTEAEEITALEAFTRRQPVKLQQTLKPSYVL
jgi:hypothetical protein